MKTLVACGLALAIASPLMAQTRSGASDYPAISPRAFAAFSQQQFAAKDTFGAVFGDSTGSFRGGGGDVVLGRRIFVEVSAARFEETGERVFLFEDTVNRLGIPLTATITPIELLGGIRFLRWERLIPYAGIGFGSFKYEETSQFNTDDENLSVKKNGLVLVGGAEFRLGRWIGVSADAHYSRVHGILGAAGISQEYGDDDLGGIAARFRVIVGR
jgi:opacity protein-like surface antigen